MVVLDKRFIVHNSGNQGAARCVRTPSLDELSENRILAKNTKAIASAALQSKHTTRSRVVSRTDFAKNKNAINV
jgi:hypothetical protein